MDIRQKNFKEITKHKNERVVANMPYIKKTCKAGKTKHVKMYYSIRWHSRKEGRREPKRNLTSEAQKKVNLRQAEEKLEKKLDANFCGDDYYLTLDYRPEERPEGKKGISEHMKRYLRTMRNLYKKAKKVFKYVWVAEVGSRGAVHIHIVISGTDDMRAVINAWTHGGTTIKPMYADGNYRKLAHYFIKYSEKTLKTTGELQGKRWNASKNLVTPVERKKVIMRDAFRYDIKPPEGYYLDKDSVRMGIHEETGYSFLKYTLVRLTC